MTNPSPPIAVLGSGMAGTACAKALADAGRAVTIFDKGRRPGGRLATKRMTLPDGTETRIDHGAQFATARDPGFADFVMAAGARRWTGERVIGAARMRGLVEPHLAGLDLRQSVRVTRAARGVDGWTLTDTDGNTVGPFGAVVSTLPAPQAAELFPVAAEALASVEIAPCWAVMAVFDLTLERPDETSDDAPDAPIAWAAREGAKPDRETRPERWILHAGPDWSRAHLEETPDAVLEKMLTAFGAGAAPIWAAAHRWRHARVTVPLGQPCLTLEEGTLILAGDWCLGARVENAYLSGRAAAQALLRPGE